MTELLTMQDLAGKLKLSYANISKLKKAGKILAPINSLGTHSPRWSAAEVEAWITAGMPLASDWEARKAAVPR